MTGGVRGPRLVRVRARPADSPGPSCPAGKRWPRDRPRAPSPQPDPRRIPGAPGRPDRGRGGTRHLGRPRPAAGGRQYRPPARPRADVRAGAGDPSPRNALPVLRLRSCESAISQRSRSVRCQPRGLAQRDSGAEKPGDVRRQDEIERASSCVVSCTLATSYVTEVSCFRVLHL